MHGKRMKEQWSVRRHECDQILVYRLGQYYISQRVTDCVFGVKYCVLLLLFYVGLMAFKYYGLVYQTSSSLTIRYTLDQSGDRYEFTDRLTSVHGPNNKTCADMSGWFRLPTLFKYLFVEAYILGTPVESVQLSFLPCMCGTAHLPGPTKTISQSTMFRL